MKKIILTCLLGGLCLFGSNLKARTKVVDSPGKGGTREFPASPDSLTSALIYGELINPDSLVPLELTFTTQYLKPRMRLDEKSIQINPIPGAFLDGVMNPKAQKFRANIPVASYAYFSLSIDDRVLLEDYLIHAGDSLMISLDLEKYQISFGGPAASWMEAQYAIRQSQNSAAFDHRILLHQDREAFLDQQDYRAQTKVFASEFGPKLQVIELGKDQTDYHLNKLLSDDYSTIPGYAALLRFKSSLSKEIFDLLKTDLVSEYYAKYLRSFRIYQYSMANTLSHTANESRLKAIIPQLSQKLRSDIAQGYSGSVSMGYNYFISEWIALSMATSQMAFEEIAQDEFSGEVLDRVLATYLFDKIKLTELPYDYWKDYSALIQLDPWKKAAQKLVASYQTGVELVPVSWKDLSGKEWKPEDLAGKPTLFYFYFSTCTHSANFFSRYLWPLYKDTKNLADYNLVAVSVDEDRVLWKNMLSKYSNTALLNVNFSEKENQEWLDRYHISAYPSTLLLDADGRILSYNLKGQDYPAYLSGFLKYFPEVSESSINPK